MAIDFSKWTEADTDLVDRGVVTVEDIEAYGGATPSTVARMKSSGRGPLQLNLGDPNRGPDPNAPIFQESRARDAVTAQNNATNDRYKSDLSWLNPEFQEQPAYLGQSAGSQVYANPADVQAQQSVYNQFGSLVGKDMGFASSAKQDQQYSNWGGVAAGQGAPVFMGNGAQQGLINEIGGLQGPSWESSARQEGVYDQIQNIKNPEFRSDADQKSVMNDLGSIAASGGHQGINFDDGARQEEQYGHLKEIVDNGGLTATERAARQKARLDEEQWIRGQREADQQQFAQRGMDGSGQQVLALGQDRQAAASRISMADLQAAADAEQRKLGAIGMASDAAGTMRGQTFNEQSYMASRGDQALVNKGVMANQLRGDQFNESMGTADVELRRAGLAADMANELRQDQYQEQAYQTGYELDKVNSKANITGQMRSQDYNEKSYNDQRILEGMRQQTNLANELRQDQYQESVATRNSDLQALSGQGNLATSMRGQSSQEAQFRAESTDHFSALNQAAYNNAEAANKNFTQNAWQSMQNNRQQWEMNKLNQGLNVAQGLQTYDARQNDAAFGAASANAGANADTWNEADARAKGAKIGAYTGGNTGVAAASANYNDAFYGGVGKSGGAFGDLMATVAGGPSTGGASAAASGGGGGGTTSTGAPVGPYRYTGNNPYVGGGTYGGTGVQENPYQKNVYG